MTSLFGKIPKNDITFRQIPKFENYREYAEISNFHMNRAIDFQIFGHFSIFGAILMGFHQTFGNLEHPIQASERDASFDIIYDTTSVAKAETAGSSPPFIQRHQPQFY